MLVVPENVVPLHTQTRNNDGAIAQLVEQRTENPCVPGSIPGGTTQKADFLTRVSFFVSLQVKCSKDFLRAHPIYLGD